MVRARKILFERGIEPPGVFVFVLLILHQTQMKIENIKMKMRLGSRVTVRAGYYIILIP
jgi:hypothetical protein